jgi:hypothetical protein
LGFWPWGVSQPPPRAKPSKKHLEGLPMGVVELPPFQPRLAKEWSSSSFFLFSILFFIFFKKLYYYIIFI